MKLTKRDESIVEHIIQHITVVENAVKRFGDSLEIFMADRDYFDAVNMNILQIGELANHFSYDFIKSTFEIPWHDIIGLRNIVAHGYGTLKPEIIWQVVKEDLPVLKEKCKNVQRTGSSDETSA
jgi:uncharacterized protein with HEPN domain